MHQKIAERRRANAVHRLYRMEKMLADKLVTLTADADALHRETGAPAFRDLADALLITRLALLQTPPLAEGGEQLRQNAVNALKGIQIAFARLREAIEHSEAADPLYA